MKKFIINVLLVLAFIIIYFLHSNLFVILVLFIGLYAHKYMGVIYGIIFGLFLDLFIGKKFGINAIMLGIIGFIGMIFDKNFSKENRITLIVMVMISTAIFEVGEYIISYFVVKSSFDIIPFIQVLLVECIYNAIITIILYPIMQKSGNLIETEYKGNKILTRYF